jgi:hypothetical protein
MVGQGLQPLSDAELIRKALFVVADTRIADLMGMLKMTPHEATDFRARCWALHETPTQQGEGVDPESTKGDSGTVTAADAGTGDHHEAGDGPVGQDHGGAEGELTPDTAGDRPSDPAGTTAPRPSVVDLMENLERSVAAAKAAREARNS